MAAQMELVQPVDVSLLAKQVAPVISELETFDEERFVLKSPYPERRHLLDVKTVPHEAGLVAKALRSLKAVREDYATAPYVESFNWPEVIEELKRLSQKSGKVFKETSFYIVAFRSKILTSTDYDYLCELDREAHAEAVASGGFLKYWFGEPDSELQNLSTCVWVSREAAMVGGRGPAHRKAVGVTRHQYAYYNIDQHRLTVRDNVDDWSVEWWKSG